jgi:hypothetical protein
MTDILALIDADIAQLKAARALFVGTTATQAGRGRPRVTTLATIAPKKKSGLTPEGRARIAAATKARWAKQKKAAK